MAKKQIRTKKGEPRFMKNLSDSMTPFEKSKKGKIKTRKGKI